MKIRLFVLAAALLFIAAPAYAVEEGDLIGGTGQRVELGIRGAIVLVSQTDGSQTLIGDPTANGSLAGLAFDSSGALWGANNIDVPDFFRLVITELIQIDPNTGTQIGPSIPLTFNGRPAAVQDLAVQPGEQMVTLPAAYLQAFGIGKDVKRRALAELETAGLIRVERLVGRTARVTLVSWPEGGFAA